MSIFFSGIFFLIFPIFRCMLIWKIIPLEGDHTTKCHFFVTSQKPDIVLYWPNEKRVILFELSVPFEPNINKAHCTKTDRYSSLVSDINEAGSNCSLVAVEIGSGGLIDTEKQTDSLVKRYPATCEVLGFEK